MKDLQSKLDQLPDQEYVYVTARSSGKNIQTSFFEAGYSKEGWYKKTPKEHRAELENLAMQVKRQRSSDARAILDEAGADFARELVKLSKSYDEDVRLKAVKEGLKYILKTIAEAGAENAESSWKKAMVSEEDEDTPWGDGSGGKK